MKKILLTSAGFENENLRKTFLDLVSKKPQDIKALFIPTAAIDADARAVLLKCWNDLLHCGIPEKNISVYTLQEKIDIKYLLEFDALYFCGGSPEYLMERIHAMDFGTALESFLEHGGTYVGVSAGSYIAAGNLPDSLGYLTHTLQVHEPVGSIPGDLPSDTKTPVKLTNNQAVLICNDRCSIIE